MFPLHTEEFHASDHNFHFNLVALIHFYCCFFSVGWVFFFPLLVNWSVFLTARKQFISTTADRIPSATQPPWPLRHFCECSCHESNLLLIQVQEINTLSSIYAYSKLYFKCHIILTLSIAGMFLPAAYTFALCIYVKCI